MGTLSSVIERAVAALGPEGVLNALTPEEAAMLPYQWQLWARPDQMPPDGDWTTWMVMTGRGWGKNRTAGEWIRQGVYDGVGLFALVGREPSQVRIQMIEHPESGILRLFPPDQKPEYEPSKRTITFHTGAVAHTYSAANPDQFRGGAYQRVWYDEFASFDNWEIYEQIQFGMRVPGIKAQQIITTTPKPVRRLRELLERPSTVVTHGTSYDNRANLNPQWYEEVIKPYVGTARGEQEIMGKLLDALPGALWNREIIRYKDPRELGIALTKIAVGVDPSLGDGETSDECGIVVVGLGEDGHIYVLADYSLRASPLQWAKAVVRAYLAYNADYMVVERNSGGRALLKQNIDLVQKGLKFVDVWASKNKQARADNPALRYELGEIWHAQPMPDLEDQLCTWIPGEGPSPDRLDALVWGIISLSKRRPNMVLDVIGRR